MTAPATASAATGAELRERRRARFAVGIAFAVNGLLVGSWAPRIPAVKSGLDLSAGALGIALLAPALGTVLAARFAGGVGARHGSARATRAFGVLYCLLAWAPGAAGTLALLWLALLVWGAAMGSFDVSMNAQGVSVEAAYRRPVLSGFHAVWSIGSFVGAVLGGLGAALDVHVALQQAVLGAVLALAVWLAGRALIADPPHEPAAPRERRGWRARMPRRRLLLLGLAAVFALMAEGAVTDWSSVLLREHLHAPSGQDSLAYAAFCVTMTAGRLAGDRVVQALGRARCLGALALAGAVGLAAGMASNTLTGTTLGFALLGLGLSIIVPNLFGAAAQSGGPSAPAIATVAALGCVGMLAGPGLIGGIAELTSVPAALYLLPPFTIAAGALGVAGIRAGRRPVG
jgi:MFS family permease